MLEQSVIGGLVMMLLISINEHAEAVAMEQPRRNTIWMSRVLDDIYFQPRNNTLTIAHF